MFAADYAPAKRRYDIVCRGQGGSAAPPDAMHPGKRKTAVGESELSLPAVFRFRSACG